MPRPHEPAAQFGKYTLLAKLASGGMGELYLAQLRAAGGFEKLVVIKRILPHLTDQREFVEMFVDEARTAARISHPNVCQIYELGQIDGRYYMALEYLEGISLSDVLVARTRAPQLADLRLITSLIAQAAEGLHHAHCLRSPDGTSLQLVHRDVNPRNIFVTSAGAAKILDFGIVKVRGALSQTGTGSIKGTYSYMAPEQLQGEPLDCRADIFSLGTILWEAVVGRRLFKRQSDMLTWKAICEDPIPRPSRYRSDLPGDLDAVTMRALARDRDHRYATARELALDLERAIKSLGAPLTTLAISAEVERAFVSQLAEQRERVFAAHRQQEAEKAGLASTLVDDWGGDDDDRDTRVADPNYAVFASTAQPRPRRNASEAPLNTPSEIHTIDEVPGEPVSAGARRPLRKPKKKAIGKSTAQFVDEVPPGFDDRWPEPVSTDPGSSSSKRARRSGSSHVRKRGSVSSSASARSRSPWPMVLALMVFGAGAAAFAYVLKKDHLDQPSSPPPAASESATAGSAVPPTQIPSTAPDAGTSDSDDGADLGENSERTARAADIDDAPALSGAIPKATAEPTKPRKSSNRASRAERRRERQRERQRQERERREAQQREAQQREKAARAAAADRAANKSVGYLTVNAKPYAMVYVNGRKKSYTPVVRLELPPGSHTVKLVPSSKAEDKTFKIQIRAGKEERKFIKW